MLNIYTEFLQRIVSEELALSSHWGGISGETAMSKVFPKCRKLRPAFILQRTLIAAISSLNCELCLSLTFIANKRVVLTNSTISLRASRNILIAQFNIRHAETGVAGRRTADCAA